jgi:dihydropyrimidinase
VTGWPIMTLSRGEIVYRDGEVLAAPGRGQFLPCGIPGPAQTIGAHQAT